ncbi:hypothetical protein DWX03_12130 [Coprococcus comes]|uniref:Uncharacterized protein n=1 Tax=Coprococcus comes TaxID=410072 RepID=A0A412QC44_9FIRM|nr:hypothetical protein [Coprococcus comes]RGT88495.1 hypothetical protein DWX03_12130 [Coprococcus comes]
MKIVSGRTGSPHVTSQQFRQMLEGIIGQGSYIITSGENLKPELSSNNLLKIRSGMMAHHGCISCVDIGTYDEVTLTNGSQGMKRIDLIVNRYTRNAETEVENCSWKVIQGTPVASNPAVPAYTSGNLQDGDLVDECPAFEVHYDGINVTEVKSLLSVTDGLSELSSKLAKSNDSIAAINNKLISIVERGEKNGYNYIKYSNGDAVVWRKYNWNTDVSVNWYGLYFTSSKAVDFPFTFKEAPLIIVSPGTTNELYWMGVNEVSTTGYKLTAYSVKKGMCYSQGNMLIIGKWK